MKLRTGFVSNSSSSSFIVSAKKGEIPKVIIEIDLPSDEEISTKEELDKWILEQWDSNHKTIEELFADEEYAKEQYDECFKEIKKGRVIHVGTVCNDDGNPKSNLIYETGLSGYRMKNGIVIEDCQG